MTTTKSKLSVDIENILPIIKKWLYSQKEIFLRELVSNSFDAINKLKKISLSEDIRDSEDTDFAINIKIERDKNLLIIEDNGLGMTADEITKYIANIAFSGASDFIKKYEESGNKDKAGIIGNFGLGFYSSFMVSDKVEVESLSYKKDAKSALWTSSGGVEFEMGEGSRKTRGTSIKLTLSEDSKEFLDKAKISELVRHFVDFLPIPVRVDGAEANKKDPIWIKSPSSLKKEEYIEFYKYLYPFQGEPLFYVHLNVDYPFQLQGILFFPRLRHEMELNKSNVKIYCKQVFVSDEAQELIPQYLTILQGVIDIPDLPLNVSRSYLQNEPHIKKIAAHIVKKVADKLKDEYQKNRSNYEAIWNDIAPFIKYAMMNDEKFYEQAVPALIFQIASGAGETVGISGVVGASDSDNKNKFITLEEYQLKHKSKINEKVYYISDIKSQAGPLKMLNEQGIDVLLLNALIDNHFIQFLETKGSNYHFTRVDAEVSEHIIDKASDSIILDKTGQDNKEQIIAFFKEALQDDKLIIRVEPLKDEKIPAMILLSEHSRRFQEMSAMMKQGAEAFNFPVEHTLLINSKNNIIKKIATPSIITDAATSNSKNKLIAREIYYLARLSQGNFSRTDLEKTLELSYQILENY